MCTNIFFACTNIFFIRQHFLLNVFLTFTSFITLKKYCIEIVHLSGLAGRITQQAISVHVVVRGLIIIRGHVTACEQRKAPMACEQLRARPPKLVCNAQRRSRLSCLVYCTSTASGVTTTSTFCSASVNSRNPFKCSVISI
jgi:hypothetical protein